MSFQAPPQHRLTQASLQMASSSARPAHALQYAPNSVEARVLDALVPEIERMNSIPAMTYSQTIANIADYFASPTRQQTKSFYADPDSHLTEPQISLGHYPFGYSCLPGIQPLSVRKARGCRAYVATLQDWNNANGSATSDPPAETRPLPKRKIYDDKALFEEWKALNKPGGPSAFVASAVPQPQTYSTSPNGRALYMQSQMQTNPNGFPTFAFSAVRQSQTHDSSPHNRALYAQPQTQIHPNNLLASAFSLATQRQTNPRALGTAQLKRGRGRPRKDGSASLSSLSSPKNVEPRYRCRFGCFHAPGFKAHGLRHHMGRIHGLFPPRVQATSKPRSMRGRVINMADNTTPCLGKICEKPLRDELALRSMPFPRNDQEFADTFPFAASLKPSRLVRIVDGNDEAERRNANKAAIESLSAFYVNDLADGASTNSISSSLSPLSTVESSSCERKPNSDEHERDASKRLKPNDLSLSSVSMGSADVGANSAVPVPVAGQAIERHGLITPTEPSAGVGSTGGGQVTAPPSSGIVAHVWTDYVRNLGIESNGEMFDVDGLIDHLDREHGWQ